MKKATHSSPSDPPHSRRAPSRTRAGDKHRAIIQAAIDGFWINDMDGRLLEVNDSYCTMIGYTREELLTMSISDIEATETPEETARHIEKVMERGCGRFQAQHRRKDGRIIDVEISANYIQAEGGQLSVFIRDITERKLAEEALEYSERNYRTLVESLPQKIFLKDRDSVYISCNRKYAEDLSIEPDDIPGHTDYDFYPQNLADKYRADDRRVIDSGETAILEERYVRQGQESVIETFKTPVKDGDGNTVGLLGIFHDITERKQAEAAREEAERNYRLITENTTDVVAIYDLDMNLLWVSPSIEKQTGYTPDEMKKAPPLETMTPESVEKVIEAFDRGRQLFEQGKEFIDHFELEAEVYRKDGSTFWADVMYRVIRDSQGQLSHVLMQGRDITEHRKADEALRESEERFRDLAELLPQTVFEADEEGRFTFINRQGQQNLGYSDEDVARGINVLQTVSSEDHARAAELIGRLRAGENLGPSEHISIRKDGSRFPVIVYGTAILEDDRYGGMRGIVVDITERKRAEEALRLSEERYRLIADNTSDCIWVMDADLRITYRSPSNERVFGYTAGDWDAISFRDWVHPDYADTVISALKGFRAGVMHDDVRMTIQARHKSGRYIWVEISASPMRRPDGRLAGIVGMSRDITERKQSEEALRLSEERYRLIAENTSDCIWIMGPDLRITYQSPSTERVFGYTAGEWEAIGFRGWVHPDYIGTVVSTLKSFREGDTKDSVTITIQARHKSGRYIWVEISASPIPGPDGKLLGVVGVSRDVTEHKEAEEALRRSETDLRFAQQVAHVGNWSWDMRRDILHWSDQLFRIYGWTSGEFSPDVDPSIELLHPDDRQLVIDAARAALDARDTFDVETRIVRPDGSLRVLHMRGEFHYDETGNAERMFGTAQDITERKEAEDRLLEYRTAVEQSADGIAIANLDGNISFANEAWARMHGYPVEELIGRHLSIFHTREQMESQVIPFNRSLQEEGSKEGEVWHVRRNGEQFPSWMTTTLLKRADGEPFGMFALMRDITGQKEMDRQQRERDIAEARAEELSRSRHRLIEAQESLRKDIASQLHGTVQNRLILLGHRLAELESRPASERTTEELASIRHTLEELQRDQIRPISHRLYPSILRLGIAAGLESLVDQYSSELPIDLRVSRNLREGEQANRKLVPDNVKLALYRVAEEVLANIAKHAPMVNSVAVKLALSDAGILRLTVSDDGPGFDTAAPRKGIGLAIISDYAAAAGASCEVKSVPGRGTRVTARVQLEGVGARPRRKGWTSG